MDIKSDNILRIGACDQRVHSKSGCECTPNQIVVLDFVLSWPIPMSGFGLNVQLDIKAIEHGIVQDWQ